MNSKLKPAGKTSGYVLRGKHTFDQKPECHHSFGLRAVFYNNWQKKSVPLTLLQMAAGDERVPSVHGHRCL